VLSAFESGWFSICASDIFLLVSSLSGIPLFHAVLALRVVEVECSCGFALRLLFIDDVAPSSALDVSFAVSLLAWRFSSALGN
jgi:hypothetical protein